MSNALLVFVSASVPAYPPDTKDVEASEGTEGISGVLVVDDPLTEHVALNAVTDLELHAVRCTERSGSSKGHFPGELECQVFQSPFDRLLVLLVLPRQQGVHRLDLLHTKHMTRTT